MPSFTESLESYSVKPISWRLKSLSLNENVKIWRREKLVGRVVGKREDSGGGRS
jgi:hypothetical protein